jgi:hypothetical protein
MLRTAFPLSLSLAVVLAGSLAAQQPPSYARQVRPFLARYCLECHNAATRKGELNLESVEGLRQGGKSGPVLLPGKPEESRFVLLPEGKAKPAMPPRKARQPQPGEAAVLRAWVAAGAKDDTAPVRTALPEIQPRAHREPPITALAYRPDGGQLAVGRHHEVLLLDPTGEVVRKLAEQSGRVTALTFSPDGQRLAVATGSPGVGGEIRLYDAAARLHSLLAGHKDIVLDLKFSPDGRLLATTGYDRLIKLWDVATSKELRTLRDHSDAVYSLAFSPDGRLLASGAADRAVKVWDVASGRRLYTLGEPTDWVYAVTWSPDGQHLAATGVDKSIRVWKVSAEAGHLQQSVFAHEAPVTRLRYAADGRTLYSVGEDRILKAWDTGRMTERRVYPAQADAVLSMAVRPDRKQIALGRYDGTVLVIEEATGKIVAQPVPIKLKPPELVRLTPAEGQRGLPIGITLEGKHLDGDVQVTSSRPGTVVKLLPEGRSAGAVRAIVTFPADTPAGIQHLWVKTTAGESARLPFTVDLFPRIAEHEPNDSARTGQRVTLPVSIAGALDRAGAVDYYRFEVRAGQQIGIQIVTAAVGSHLDPLLELVDASGTVVAESGNGVLGFTCAKAGSYALGVRDKEYKSRDKMHYRLHLGGLPVIASVFPLGVPRGTETEVHLEGVNLGAERTVRVKVPAEAAVGSRLPVRLMTPAGPPLGEASVVVGDLPEVRSAEPPTAGPASVPVPGTANGRLLQPGATQSWRFTARKGQRFILEVNAHRLGSPLDSLIEVLDLHGKPVPRATLRSLARTFVTFTDHDSVKNTIRMDSWNEFAMNDYVWVGNELLRIHDLPKNPDDDCTYWAVDKRRLAFLDTTPAHLSLGLPMYKVAIHPPGTRFPPNGFPVIELPYRNDDGGPGYGKDSRLFFDAPADGEYLVRISDARGEGGPGYAYRLTVRPPRPSFTVRFEPTAPAVWRGGAVPITVSAERLDGYEGPIEVWLDGLPAGLSAPRTTIPTEEYTTTFALNVEPNGKVPDKAAPFKLIGRAEIDGHAVVREAAGGVPKVVDPGDLVTTTEQAEVTVRPGQQVTMTARVERRNGFKGRVPLEVEGLPHGVRVLDIGLNGILITEKETKRSFVIYAEPWVEPTVHPFVVLATHEAKGTKHAARSVLLKVAGPQ